MAILRKIKWVVGLLGVRQTLGINSSMQAYRLADSLILDNITSYKTHCHDKVEIKKHIDQARQRFI